MTQIVIPSFSDFLFTTLRCSFAENERRERERETEIKEKQKEKREREYKVGRSRKEISEIITEAHY